jgi:hypothetical protein
MEKNSIENFVHPIRTPKGKPVKNQIPFFCADLGIVDIHDKTQKGDDVPLEISGIPQNVKGLLG